MYSRAVLLPSSVTCFCFYIEFDHIILWDAHMRIPGAKNISSKYVFSKLNLNSIFLPAALLLLLLVPGYWSCSTWCQSISTEDGHHIFLFYLERKKSQSRKVLWEQFDSYLTMSDKCPGKKIVDVPYGQERRSKGEKNNLLGLRFRNLVFSQESQTSTIWADSA